MSVCRGCGAKVSFAFNEDGQSVVMNARPDENGTWSLDAAGIVERIDDLMSRERARRNGRRFFTAHECEEGGS